MEEFRKNELLKTGDMRLFVAIPMPPVAQAIARNVADRFADTLPDQRWIEPHVQASTRYCQCSVQHGTVLSDQSAGAWAERPTAVGPKRLRRNTNSSARTEHPKKSTRPGSLRGRCRRRTISANGWRRMSASIASSSPGRRAAVGLFACAAPTWLRRMTILVEDGRAEVRRDLENADSTTAALDYFWRVTLAGDGLIGRDNNGNLEAEFDRPPQIAVDEI